MSDADEESETSGEDMEALVEKGPEEDEDIN